MITTLIIAGFMLVITGFILAANIRLNQHRIMRLERQVNWLTDRVKELTSDEAQVETLLGLLGEGYEDDENAYIIPLEDHK